MTAHMALVAYHIFSTGSDCEVSSQTVPFSGDDGSAAPAETAYSVPSALHHTTLTAASLELNSASQSP